MTETEFWNLTDEGDYRYVHIHYLGDPEEVFFIYEGVIRASSSSRFSELFGIQMPNVLAAFRYAEVRSVY